MVLAADTLFVAGPLDRAEETPHEPSGVDVLAESLETQSGGRLLAVSAVDGRPLAEYDLKSPPVFDGMAAAHGRVYLSTKDGKIACLAQ